MRRKKSTWTSLAGVCGVAALSAPAAAQQSCIVKLDVPYDFADPLGTAYDDDPANASLDAWQDNYDFAPPLQKQRSPDYVQVNLSPTNVRAGPNSDDANGGFAALYAANNPSSADGVYVNYDFSSESGLDTGGDVTVSFDYAPGHWHTPRPNGEWVADAQTEVRAYVGDGAAYAGQPLANANPFLGGAQETRLLTGAYQGQDDGDPDSWPDMPEASQTAPGTSWRSHTIRRDLDPSKQLYVGITGWAPGGNNARRAIFLDAINVLVTSRETDLALTATGPGGPVNPTDETQFTVTIVNEGGSDEDPIVQVTLPDGFTQVGNVAGLTGGQWAVGSLAIGQTRTLTIPVRVDQTGPYGSAFTAEIAADEAGGGASDDCDSTPLNTSGTEDDEANAPVTVGTNVLSGQVFVDEGAGGATAFDGFRSGVEAGVSGLVIKAKDQATGRLLLTTSTTPDGKWFLPVGAAIADKPIIIKAFAPESMRFVSEGPGPFPAGDPGNPRNGTIRLTPPSGQSTGGVDFGLLTAPQLAQDRAGAIAPGDLRRLGHRYTASGPGDVTFSVTSDAGPSSSSFETTLHRDGDCDGQEDGPPLSGAISAGTDEVICVVVKVAAGRDLAIGSELTLVLTTDTAYGVTTLTDNQRNTDRLTVTGGAVLTLSKAVCNLDTDACDLASGAGFGEQNGAAPGERLRYRLRFESVGEQGVDVVTVQDATPSFTGLVANSVQIGRAPPGTSCAATQPPQQTEGYQGIVVWECTGTMRSGSVGVVAFDVRVSD